MLLKDNLNLLPNQFQKAKFIAVIGDSCNKTASSSAAGGGSGHVCCEPVVTPLIGIEQYTAKYGNNAHVYYAGIK